MRAPLDFALLERAFGARHKKPGASVDALALTFEILRDALRRIAAGIDHPAQRGWVDVVGMVTFIQGSLL